MYEAGPTQFVAITAQQPQPRGEILQTIYAIYAIAPDAVINVTLSTDASFEYDDAFDVLIETLLLGVIPGFST